MKAKLVTIFFTSIILFSCSKDQLDPNSMAVTKTDNVIGCIPVVNWSLKTNPGVSQTSQNLVEFNYSTKACDKNQPIKTKLELVNTNTNTVVDGPFDSPLSFKYVHALTLWEPYRINLYIYDATTNTLIVQRSVDFIMSPTKLNVSGIWN